MHYLEGSMGCLKLSYYEAGEGTGETAFFSGENLKKKEGTLKNRYNYYPFGLTFNSYKREFSKKNRYLYNDGAERIDDLDLGIDLTKYRAYDPAMGRWWQIDPKTDGLVDWTPYNYSFNNPIRYNDPDGDCPPGVDCSSYWIGFGASVVDNIFGGLTNVRETAANYIDDARSFNTGQDHGDVSSIVAGTAMVDGGSATATGGGLVLAITGGTTAPVIGTAAEVGLGVAAEGGVIILSGASSLKNQKGRLNAQGSGEGRGKNRRQPDNDATGDHSVINERGSSTFEKNSNNPSGWQETSHIDTQGAAHTHKQTGQKVDVPHRQGKYYDTKQKIPGGVEPVKKPPVYTGPPNN